MRNRLVILMFAFLGGVIGCGTSWRHISTLEEHRGQVLRIPGPGEARLEIEAEYDAAVRNLVATHDEPDYILVESLDVLRMIYIDDDRVLVVDRSDSLTGEISVEEPIPAEISTYFARRDRERLGHVRGESLPRTDTPTPALTPLVKATPNRRARAKPPTHAATTPKTAAIKRPTARSSNVLATGVYGGWRNVDFIVTEDPLAAAKECVRQYQSAEAAACYAFPSEAAYRISKPVAAGNLKGPLCWTARWLRNKHGEESGGLNPYGDPQCSPKKAAARAAKAGPVKLALLSGSCKRGRNPADRMSQPDDFTCIGSVKNVSAVAMSQVKVVIRLFDRNGRHLGRDGGRIRTLPLRAGATSKFEVIYYASPDSIASYKFHFETFLDEPIPHRDER